jgi:eukaryotic-like serine/threonine-protein kinase
MQTLYTLYFLFLLILILASLFLLSKKRIRNPIPLAFIFSALIAIPIISGYFIIVYSAEKPEVATPSLNGLPLNEAIDKLKSRRLKFKIQEHIYADHVPQGLVIRHYPEAGQRVKVGRTVSLIISQGKQSLTVPKLVGHHVKQIDVILKASDLTINKVNRVYSKIQENGTVVSQFPPAGTTVEAGTGIDVTVSVDPDKEEELNEEVKEEKPHE